MSNKNSGSGAYHGIWPVLVTPYDSSLRVDTKAYRQMLEWHLKNGCHGLYALCLSSEMFYLTDAERRLLVSETVSVCGGEVPIAVTGNLNSTIEEQIDFIKWSSSAGADVTMLLVPQDLDSEDQMEDYFLKIAEDCGSVRLGIYECPYPAHITLSPALVGKLAKTGRFFCYKETSCELEIIEQKVAALSGSPLAILQANIPFLLDAQDLGCHGSMNVAANWLPDLAVQIYEKYCSGEKDHARLLHEILCTLELAQRSIHPSGVKYLMAQRGLNMRCKSRSARQITSEEKRAIETLAKHWFLTDGSLLQLEASRLVI